MNTKMLITINTISVCLLCLNNTKAKDAQEKIENAAFLYYQAFLICPETDELPNQFQRFGWGLIDSYPELQLYLTANQNAIQLFSRASKIQECNWLIQNSAVKVQINTHRRPFLILLGADARYSAMKGDYITGFDQCMAMFRYAKHLRQDRGRDFAEYVEIAENAYRCIGKILDIMPPDEKNLQYVQNWGIMGTATGLLRVTSTTTTSKAAVGKLKS